MSYHDPIEDAVSILRDNLDELESEADRLEDDLVSARENIERVRSALNALEAL